VAETVGLIDALGEWVLGRACAEVARWPVAVKLAINVSAVQFIRGNLVDVVARALQASGLDGRRLDIEITESLFVEDYEQVQAIMAELRRLGVGFALDDFGTGYSSLAYLQRLSIDKVKLDQSFVAGLPFDQEAAAIVRAVGALTQSLGIRLNAEGIEQADQVAFLRLIGCEEGQGYLFGAPMPARDILAKLAPDAVKLPA
jgi:EAL domain-containing protein (putative c-di-GMP-specific phosphodiesterase class I)